MSRTPFSLRSGNNTPFKMMGSSPLRQETKMLKGTTIFGKTTGELSKSFKKKAGYFKEHVKSIYERGKSLLSPGSTSGAIGGERYTSLIKASGSGTKPTVVPPPEKGTYSDEPSLSKSKSIALGNPLSVDPKSPK